jgi:hypothetical protein
MKDSSILSLVSCFLMMLPISYALIIQLIFLHLLVFQEELIKFTTESTTWTLTGVPGRLRGQLSHSFSKTCSGSADDRMELCELERLANAARLNAGGNGVTIPLNVLFWMFAAFPGVVSTSVLLAPSIAGKLVHTRMTLGGKNELLLSSVTGDHREITIKSLLTTISAHLLWETCRWKMNGGGCAVLPSKHKSWCFDVGSGASRGHLWSVKQF